MIETIEDMLIRHENIKFKPYKCSAGKLTIGVGRNLDDKGINQDEAMYLLHNDIDETERDLANNIFKGRFYEFPKSIQLVLLNMRFQLGYSGFRGFKKMIQAFKDRDYEEAIVQMKDSTWHNKQVPNRAKDLIKMVKEIL